MPKRDLKVIRRIAAEASRRKALLIIEQAEKEMGVSLNWMRLLLIMNYLEDVRRGKVPFPRLNSAY